MKTVVEAISRMLGLGGKIEQISLENAIAEWGAEMAHFAFGSNSQVTATKARKMLSWNPTSASLWDEIESGYYHHKYAQESTS
ncbi:Epimerase (fragment) [Hyella patelloides LEGE 07179]|uniref:Epimerase n=1 Tax=Hyella patelloides LEGE 07179 TaxID=945734 RepID=A0A563VS91_9CYAN